MDVLLETMVGNQLAHVWDCQLDLLVKAMDTVLVDQLALLLVEK